MKKIEADRSRREQLIPAGIPRYVRCYDNGGETFDRYTVVFTGRYRHKTGKKQWYLGMSADPFHPQGVGSHGESETSVDTPKYSHLGKKVKFENLPQKVKECVIQTYVDLWDLKM